jgi:hypothetical protein
MNALMIVGFAIKKRIADLKIIAPSWSGATAK